MATNRTHLKSLVIAWVLAGICTLCFCAERVHAESHAMLLQSMNDCKQYPKIAEDLKLHVILKILVGLSWLAFVGILLLIKRPKTAFGFMACLLGAFAICTSNQMGLAHCLLVFAVAIFLSPVVVTISESVCWGCSRLTVREG